ncbi:MAG: hypothetical protein AAF658_05630 [Myxococcota bacterium]
MLDNNLSRNDAETSIGIGGDFGAGFRFWFNDAMAVRLDIGQVIYFEGSNFETDLHLHAGLSFNLKSED